MSLPATPALPSPPARKDVNITGLSWLLIKRATASVLLVVALVVFVTLAMSLSRYGGLDELAAALPESLAFSVGYARDLLSGQVETTGLAELVGRSLGLLAASLALATVVGLLLGSTAAAWRHRKRARLVLLASLIGVSTPSFLVAMLLLWLNIWLGNRLGTRLLPAYGFGWDAHIVIPMLVLAAAPVATITRLGFNTLSSVLEADYVRTAHAKGLQMRDVFNRHVLRSASVPLLTTIGVSIRYSLASLPIVEYIFNWRGVGLILLQSIQSGNITAAVTLILPLALVFVVTNILLEVAYTLLDPRVRLGVGGAV